MNSLWQPLAVIAAVALAISLRFIPKLRGHQFTAWIIAAVTAVMIFPTAFLKWGDFNLRDKWLMLVIIQFVMFGMGTQMSLKDFEGVAKMPRGVLVGIICHFSVMPLVGFGLTKLFHFEPEIAAGIILIGSCSSGLASNVMAYIARSNLVLSVTVTAITTMLAPLMTPRLMQWLAGELVTVPVLKMTMDIIEVVLVPIGAALLHDYLKTAPLRRRKVVHGVAASGVVWLVFLVCGGWAKINSVAGERMLAVVTILSFLLAAVIAGLVYHELVKRFARIEKVMPVFSMFGIVYFTLVTTAAGRDNLMKVGGLLFLAAVIHNAAGYVFGYWFSRLAKLDKSSARSVSFEVGLQNGGMAAAIANSMNMLGTMGLAAAIFSPWMNISGSILANYWRKRGENEESSPARTANSKDC